MITLRITGYDPETSRDNPLGLHLTYDMDSDRPIVAASVAMEDGSTPVELTFPVKKGTDGRYVRGFNIKPTVPGAWHFVVRVRDDQGEEAEARSETPVTVTDTSGGTDPEPDDELDLTLEEWDVVEQMHDRFADDFAPTEDGARLFTEMVNQQLKYSFPRRGFCWKKATEDRPPSKDSVCRQVGRLFGGWDILSAAGVSGPRYLVPYPPGYHDLTGQVPIEVRAINHLGI